MVSILYVVQQKNHLIVNEKREMWGWLNASIKSTETRDDLSTTCNQKVMSRCLSAPDAASLHHCLQNHRQYFNILRGIQALDMACLKGFVTPFYTAIVVLFQAFPGS